MYKFLLVFLVAAASTAAQAQPLLPLQPRDIFALEMASDPQISPDGGQIAYVRQSNDITSDQTRPRVWLINADGGQHRPLGPEGVQTTSPRWSADGLYLAYLLANEETVSIRIYTPETGRDVERVRVRGGVSGLDWSPDSKRLAFAGFVAESAVEAASLPNRSDDMVWAPGARVEDRLLYRVDGVGALPPGRQQLFILDRENGEAEQVTEDARGAGSDFSWTADGNAIVFSADRRDGGETLAPDSEIHRLTLSDGTVDTLTHREGPDFSPRPSADGRWLAYLGHDDHRMGYENVQLYVALADGRASRALAPGLDRSVANPQWNADGSGLYVQYEDHGDTVIALIELDGTVTPQARGVGPSTLGRPYAGGEFTVAQNGRFAATLSTPLRPAELAIGSAHEALHAVTNLNGELLDQRTLSDAEPLSWASPFDGREIQGWALYPPDFDPAQTYPLILEIHGGPFTAYGPAFSAELQLMAAAGYVVVYTNPRGSTSYGYEFANLIHHDYPGHDYDDLMGVIDLMLGRGFIDETRLFVTGGSGGGVLTAWIIGSTDRFAAAAVVKPVINWTSFVLYSDLPQFFYRYWFANPPWEDPEEYWRRSPLSLVGQVSTPTLVMVGGADVRTPRAESEQYYSALRLRGVPSRLVIIPDSFHGISNSRPSRLLSKVAEILRWFEMYDPESEEVTP